MKKNYGKEVIELKLSHDELYEINGGAFSSALGNFIINAYNFVVDLGRYFGSAISHMFRKTNC